jgi:hypothetical protein
LSSEGSTLVFSLALFRDAPTRRLLNELTRSAAADVPAWHPHEID